MRHGLKTLLLVAIPSLLAAGCASTTNQPMSPLALDQRRPVFDARVKLAGGDFEHDIHGSFKDDTSASFLGLQVEGNTRSGFGGGVSVEMTQSDDDLFANQAATSAQDTIVEIDPYFLYRVRAGERFRMPVRFGPWIHVLTLEDQNSSDTLDWVSLGLRAAVEPEFALVRAEDFELSLFAELSVAGGSTRIHLDSSGGDEDFDSSSAAFGFEFGPRFRWSHFHAGVSYLHRGLAVDESDPENNAVVRAIDTSFDAIAFSFGGGF